MVKHILITLLLPASLTFCGSNRNGKEESMEVSDTRSPAPVKKWTQNHSEANDH